MLNVNFYLGVFFAWGISAAIADWMGLEAYIQYINNNWIDMPWTFGAVVALLALALAIKEGVSNELAVRASAGDRGATGTDE